MGLRLRVRSLNICFHDMRFREIILGSLATELPSESKELLPAQDSTCRPM